MRFSVHRKLALFGFRNQAAAPQQEEMKTIKTCTNVLFLVSAINTTK